MDGKIIYYIAYKTGYIQRTLNKQLDKIGDIKILSSTAAVSPDDLKGKFSESLEDCQLIFIVGGLSGSDKRNVMSVLSDYFNDSEMDVDFNKRIVNPHGGKDGYLIKTNDRYIVVLPDEPEHIQSMAGEELFKNIDVIPSEPNTDSKPQITTHSIVFAPEPDYTLDSIGKKRGSSILLKVCIAVGIITVVCSVVWAVYELLL